MSRFFSYFKVLIILAALTACRNKSIEIPSIALQADRIAVVDSLNHSFYPFSRKDIHFTSLFNIDTGLYYVNIFFPEDLKNKSIEDLNIPVQITFAGNSWDILKNSFHWTPNMEKNLAEIISQHTFRSPAIILTSGQQAVSIIPDLALLEKNDEVPYYLDLHYSEGGIIAGYGISDYKVVPHQYYKKSGRSFHLKSTSSIGFYIISLDHSSTLQILEKTNQFLWNHYAARYTRNYLPQVLPFKDYAKQGYDMALEKFWVKGKLSGTGGITLSTFYDPKDGLYRGRDHKDDIWFHSWFNNARTAYGLYLWGKESDNSEWCDKASSVINLLLSAPDDKGFFPTIWVPGNNQWISSGQGGGDSLYHIPDNAWTAIWLLRFNDELKKISGSNAFLDRFSHALLKIQNPDGSFPSRIKVSDHSADPVLRSAASGALATWFLEEMVLKKHIPGISSDTFKLSIQKSLEFLEINVLPRARFEDFEVYFSCSPKPLNYFDSITWQYPENTLSIQWCAEAFLKAFIIYGEPRYLHEGEYCLNILSLYQQIWNPPFINFYAFGGFGTQNSDAEWSDARQAQFAETYLNYYFVTGNPEYLQRGVAACRASFALMAIPENKEICPLNYMGTTVNGEYQGAMAENFGHSGTNERSGQSGFHWGTGSALTTAAIFADKLGDLYIDPKRREITGINGMAVTHVSWGDTIGIKTKGIADVPKPRIKMADETGLEIPVKLNGEIFDRIQY